MKSLLSLQELFEQCRSLRPMKTETGYTGCVKSGMCSNPKAGEPTEPVLDKPEAPKQEKPSRAERLMQRFKKATAEDLNRAAH